MKPLICPQCGGKITEYSQWQQFATCDYCGSKFLIEPHKQVAEPVDQPLKTTTVNPNVFIGIIAAAIFAVGGIFLIAVLTGKKETKPERPIVYQPPVFPTATPRISPTPNPNLLEFGGKGTANGLFKDADALAVDSKGRIYVADNSLRVQQFDEKGNFLKVWQIPATGKHYRRARTIQKIAVDEEDRLYVLVGGVVQMWEQNTIELPEMTYHNAPDFMVDFALRSDGGLLLISVDDNIETLTFLSKSGQVIRNIKGFHTETADAALSPHETGLAAIRVAVDGAGNIFSVYAFGDLGSYQLSYNTEELMIFRFTPQVKYVNKFVQSMNSCGIEVDNQSRIYISDDDSIKVYSNLGEQVGAVSGVGNADAFALDKQNFIYILRDDRVIKRPAI